MKLKKNFASRDFVVFSIFGRINVAHCHVTQWTLTLGFETFNHRPLILEITFFKKFHMALSNGIVFFENFSHFPYRGFKISYFFFKKSSPSFLSHLMRLWKWGWLLCVLSLFLFREKRKKEKTTQKRGKTRLFIFGRIVYFPNSKNFQPNIFRNH